MSPPLASYPVRVVGQESPWGWMLVGFLVGLFGAETLVLWSSPAAVAAGVALCAIGGLVVFVSGVAAGVANGIARARSRR
jgi:hypothetical protein